MGAEVACARVCNGDEVVVQRYSINNHCVVGNSAKDHILETEYVVLKHSSSDYTRFNTGGQSNGYNNIVKLLEENGYEVYYKHGSVLTIYKKPN